MYIVMAESLSLSKHGYISSFMVLLRYISRKTVHTLSSFFFDVFLLKFSVKFCGTLTPQEL